MTAPQNGIHTTPEERVARLDFWSGRVEPEPITGGITNVNFRVKDAGRTFFVRTGTDNPVHGIVRANELAASRIAAEAGVSPEIRYVEPGIIVFDFIDGNTYSEEDVRSPETLPRIVDLLKRVHDDMARMMPMPAPFFWPFQVCRHYERVLKDEGPSDLRLLTDLMARNDRLESELGPIEPKFGHNDLLAANFIDDGDRLWLIDWDYAGYNSPFFDLAGLSSNNGFTKAQDVRLLGLYLGEEPGEREVRRLRLMKCASLLRETLWSMASEKTSTIDFDFADYTRVNFERLDRLWSTID